MSKPKRKLADIREEKKSLCDEYVAKVDSIRAMCASKIPQSVVSGSYQDVVEFKAMVEKNFDINYPSETLAKSSAKVIRAQLDKLNGILVKFKAFYG